MTTMRCFAVLSAIGPDRTGIVSDLTEHLLKMGANVEDSRMAVLGGDFAVILLFSAEESALEHILAGEERLAREAGLSLLLRRTSARPEAIGPSLLWRVTAVAMDHPGIVHRLAQAVARRTINILELSSQTAPAPVSGTPVFSLEMKVSVPAEHKPSVLREELRRLGEEEGADVEVHPLS